MEKTSIKTESQFSCGENIKNTVDLKTTNLKAVYDRIKNDEDLKLKTLNLRTVEQSQYREAKLKLPYILFSGMFNKRSKAGLIKHSGFICVDIDKLEDIIRVKSELILIPFMALVFTSPSDKGLKAIIKIDISKATHLQYFKALERFLKVYSDIEIDPACKDESRACLICHDESPYYNEFSEVLSEEFVKKFGDSEEEIVENQSSESTSNQVDTIDIELSKEFLERKRRQIIRNAEDRISKADNGTKHDTLLKQANYLGFYIVYGIITFEEATHILVDAVSERKIDSLKDAKKTIIEGLKHGIKNYPSPDELGLISGPEIYYISEDSKGNKKIQIPYIRVYRFLNYNGFWLYIKNTSRVFIRVENNIISSIDKFDIIQFILKYIKSLPWELDEGIYRDDVEELFRKRLNVLFSESQLFTCELFSPNFNRDNEYASYFYYSNGFLTVTKDNKELLPYSELNGHIWDTQILDREYITQTISDKELQQQSEFARFLLGVSNNRDGKNENRYNSLRTLLGYLLSNYKSPSNSKAVIFCDEKISQTPEGGTGKGIVLKSISKFQNCALIDGKNFSFNSQFAFQQINLDTELIVFEDVEALFNFERLFSVITEGISVEKKNKDRFFIPYEEAPKVIITTNYTIEGFGSSHERRRVEYEFSQFYNLDNTPHDEFGHNLYDGWNIQQWHLFDQFMMNNVQLFLNVGIIDPPQINIAKRKLLDSTGEEFIHFSETVLHGYIGQEVAKSHLKVLFLNQFPEFEHKNWFTQRFFNRWLRNFARVYQMDCRERVSNNVQLILINTK